MRANIIEKAKSIIDNRRQNEERIAYYNKIDAMKDPSFKKLYSSYMDKMISDAKNGINDQEGLNALKKNCDSRLKELGIGSIETTYFCEKCQDKGIINGKYCDCLIDEVNKILKKESGFFNLESFDDANFDLFENKEFIKKLYDLAKKWCHSNFDKYLVFLSGQTGVGKTHLIKCMANELINLHKVVLLTSSFAMHQDFIKSYSSRDPEEKQNILTKYLEAEVLFIDDLGTELRQPNITVNYLYQVLNERKLNRLPTIITTNLDIADINDYYDERIASRIADKSSSICLYINGEDLRLKKNF